MKVKELVAKLQKYDSEDDIFYEDDEGQQRLVEAVDEVECIKSSFYGLIPIKNKDLFNSVFVTIEEKKSSPINVIFLNKETYV